MFLSLEQVIANLPSLVFISKYYLGDYQMLTNNSRVEKFSDTQYAFKIDGINIILSFDEPKAERTKTMLLGMD